MKALTHTSVLALISTASTSVINQFSSQQRLTGTDFGIPNVDATYDYVIVGGGLAGSTIAARLSENPNISVALIEAGNFYETQNGNWSQIPYYSTKWVSAKPGDVNPLIDWGLVSEPQVNGAPVHYAQGKNLGGSSGRNQMLYHRPTVGAYQAWADHVGDQAYTWDNQTTYLERSMAFTPPDVAIRATNASVMYETDAFVTYSNASNPLQVSYPAFAQPISSYAQAAFDNAGIPRQAGLSSGVLNGSAYWTFTIDPKTGLRSSSESSFLYTALGRPGLTVYPNALANNVVFNGTVATGVNVTSNTITGQYPFTLTAKREVLLAAGAWHSPQILMLSGIGPAATLQKFDIPIISNLSGVGQNMHDTANIAGPTWPIRNDGIAVFGDWQTPGTIDRVSVQLLQNASGPLTNMGVDFVGWEKLPVHLRNNFSQDTAAALAAFPADWPELELSFSSSAATLGFSSSAQKTVQTSVLLVATTSTGNMTIRSNSILDRPIISPNWLTTETDQQLAIGGYRRARELWNATSPTLKPENSKGLQDEIYPGANVTSDADLLEAIKNNIAAIHHATASCAMGKVGEPDTVVDSTGHVVGVQNLRVVDSSALPFTPPGHTQGVTYGFAEYMAQLVLEDWAKEALSK